MRYFIVAGERSGDIHGAKLMEALKCQDQQAYFTGVGGDLMMNAGLILIKHYKHISFMGLTSVIKNAILLIRSLSLVKERIRIEKPDLLILIDYPGFNLRLAKFAYGKGLKTCYYISPKIWAWNRGRIKSIKKYVQKMLVIFPFEVKFYKDLNYHVEYVGCPIVEQVEMYVDSGFISNKLKIGQRTRVAVMPGSRVSEIENHLTIIGQFARSRPDLCFMISTVDNVSVKYYKEISNIDNCELKPLSSYEILSQSDIAIVASGTATLETALFDIPQVVIYKTNWITYCIGRLLLRINFISLVNIIANRKVVEELIQGEFNPKRLCESVDQLLNDLATKKRISEGYSEIRDILSTKKASENAATQIIKMF